MQMVATTLKNCKYMYGCWMVQDVAFEDVLIFSSLPRAICSHFLGRIPESKHTKTTITNTNTNTNNHMFALQLSNLRRMRAGTVHPTGWKSGAFVRARSGPHWETGVWGPARKTSHALFSSFSRRFGDKMSIWNKECCQRWANPWFAFYRHYTILPILPSSLKMGHSIIWFSQTNNINKAIAFKTK